MANSLYDKAREAFGNAQISWTADTIKALLVDTSAYTVNLATHQYLSDIAGGARVGTAQTLGTKTNTAGVFDAADISVTGLSSAPTVEAIVIYQDTGTESTSRLISYIDTATGLPTPAGASSITVAWDNGANKICKI